MFISDEISAVVGRGGESWPFFAFMFAAICGLGLTIIDDVFKRMQRRVKIPVKIAWFVGMFYLVMVNAWFDNRLVVFLAWLKGQPQ